MIGWALDRTVEDDLTLAALRMALEQRQPTPDWSIIPIVAASMHPTITRIC